jgi:hypothetical protein
VGLVRNAGPWCLIATWVREIATSHWQVTELTESLIYSRCSHLSGC